MSASSIMFLIASLSAFNCESNDDQSRFSLHRKHFTVDRRESKKNFINFYGISWNFLDEKGIKNV